MTENGFNSLPQRLENGRKKNGPDAVDAALPTLRHSKPEKEVQHMPFIRQYIHSARLRNTQSNLVARFSHFNGGAFNE